MSYTLTDVISEIQESREKFYKHVNRLAPEQWTWKPYPECKSILETIEHLIIDDYAALSSLETGKEPDYDSFAVGEKDPEKLIQLQKESSEKLIAFLKKKYEGVSLDSEAMLWGHPVKVGALAVRLSSEYHYHAGQAAFIRMATDPKWNYYGDVYGV